MKTRIWIGRIVTGLMAALMLLSAVPHRLRIVGRTLRGQQQRATAWVESLTPSYTITAARREDLTRLAAIELAAARLLAGHAPESVLSETTSLDVLKQAQREGHLW